MRCKTCDYPLWNLKARQCPECGAPFAPSDFQFIVNSVEYCCPYCEQRYFGTGTNGHLVPREFNCVTCDRRIAMDEMMLRPAEGVHEVQTRVDQMPWLERQRRGWFKAWIATVGKSLINPASLIRGVPPESGMGSACWFFIATFLIVTTTGTAVPLLIAGVVQQLNRGRGLTEMMLVSAAVLAGSVVVMFLLTLLWGTSVHAILRMTGGAAFPMHRTMQCLLYSAGTNITLAIPCIGPYCGSWVVWIWWIVSAIIMVVHGQRISGIRASLAVLVLPILATVVSVGGYFMLISSVLQSARAAQTAVMTAPNNETAAMAQAILTYAKDHNGEGPKHALQMASTSFGAFNYISTFSATDPTTVNVAGTTLDQIDVLSSTQRAAVTQAAVDDLGSDVIAHRCGDFVFTHHGIDLNACDPGLWVVIRWPENDATMRGQPFPTVIGRADGSTQILSGSIESELALQNGIRAAANLPPLPHPADVTHEQPARGTPPK